MRERKKKRMIVVSFAILFIVSIMMFVIDFNQAKNDQEPEFAKVTTSYEDGGSKKYVGLFYQIYHVKMLSEVEDSQIIDYGFYMKPWFYSLDRLKKQLLDD